MLDNTVDLIFIAPDDASVTRWVRHFCGKHRSHETVGPMQCDEFLDGLIPDERHVAGKDQQVARVARKSLACSHDGMTCPELLFLIHEGYARQQGFEHIGLVADHHGHRARNRMRGPYNML